MDIARLRLANQRLAGALQPASPDEAVAWLVAVQAQDYAGAKWAVGQRLRAATDSDVESAFARGAILRTHVLRPTWHLVTAADIRWMLALTAPHVHAASALMYRRAGLDRAAFGRAHTILRRELTGGRHLTRDELRAALGAAGLVSEAGVRMTYIMMHAELEGLVCSGARRGKQHTYALLDERVPAGALSAREEARARLAARYFASRGPATVRDFAYWSGLPAAEARTGLEAVGGSLHQEGDFWFAESGAPPTDGCAYLLPTYDELLSSYKDRGAIADPPALQALRAKGPALTGILLLGGQVAGTWRRTLSGDSVVVEVEAFTRLSGAGRRAVAAAAVKYGEFLGLRPRLEWAPRSTAAGR